MTAPLAGTVPRPPVSGHLSAQDDRRREVALRVTDAGVRAGPDRCPPQRDRRQVTLTAGDTPHGFSVDDYRIAKRVAPDKPLRFEFRADTTGAFRFYCSLTGADGRPHDEHGELVVRRLRRAPPNSR